MERESSASGRILTCGFGAVVVLTLGALAYPLMARNCSHAELALQTAQEGIDRAFQELRKNPDWREGLEKAQFTHGLCTLTIDHLPNGNLALVSTGRVRRKVETIQVEAALTVLAAAHAWTLCEPGDTLVNITVCSWEQM